MQIANKLGRISDSIFRAEAWLQKQNSPDYKSISLAKAQRKKEYEQLLSLSEDVNTIFWHLEFEPIDLINLERRHLTKLCGGISVLANKQVLQLKNLNEIREVLICLAVSHATQTDTELVCLLLKAATRLGKIDDRLDSVVEFLISQQSHEGYYGRLSIEFFAATVESETQMKILISLTMEVISALSSVSLIR